MKTITTAGAQGDLYVRRIDALPGGTKEVAVTGQIVVAHSETGHNHVVEAEGVRFYQHKDPTLCYLSVEGPFADIQHARSFDTHETLRLPTGIWEIRRQQELTPEGWKMVQD